MLLRNEDPGLTPAERKFFDDYEKHRIEAQGSEYDYCDFKIERNPVSPSGKGRKKYNVWFHSEDGGNVEAVANLVSEFIAKFPLRKNLIFSLMWACWCDRPRLDEFTGGSVVVSAEGQKWFSASSLADEEISRLQDKKAYEEVQDKLKAPPLSSSEEAHLVWRNGEGVWRSKPLKGAGKKSSVAAVGSAIVFGGASSNAGDAGR
jgi:hypothetical protein